MGNITTTLLEILEGELLSKGLSEFEVDNQSTFFSNDHAFIKKVMKYDNDVSEIVDVIFFQGLTLENSKIDRQFKRAFVNRFLDRQIAFQTVEVFSSKLVFYMLANMDYINKLYNDLEKYINESEYSEAESNRLYDNRQALSTLPQNEVNTNVDNTVLTYADENRISREKENNKNNEKRQKNNLENLLKTKGLIEQLFIDLDSQCFLQIW